ncbi:dephospho-CoA kinase [Ktedonobacteria bacterium brp13]|nr:dephospho-CoA kinase [Ktedonobacteria bacterium brp13]
MSRVIGITGNIACGKSAVGQILLEAGVERYIDADALVHYLYERGQVIAQEVGAAFGEQVLNSDGSVNRQVLGAIVFNNSEALKRLEGIVHPAVSRAVRQELDTVSEQGIAVLDAVKLLEGGSAALCQSKWLVICAPEKQLERLMQRNHLSETEAHMRLSMQPDTRQRMKLVDVVIDNSGTLAETRQQVLTALHSFVDGTV